MHPLDNYRPTYQNNNEASNVEPNATIYVVTGAAGCSEMHEPFTRDQPPRSAFRSNNFGYSTLTVHNDSHLTWRQIMTDPTFFGPEDYGRIIDETVVVQHSHGPFDPKSAPSSTRAAESVSQARATAANVAVALSFGPY